jgi:hypothetical protein
MHATYQLSLSRSSMHIKPDPGRCLIISGTRLAKSLTSINGKILLRKRQKKLVTPVTPRNMTSVIDRYQVNYLHNRDKGNEYRFAKASQPILDGKCLLLRPRAAQFLGTSSEHDTK